MLKSFIHSYYTKNKSGSFSPDCLVNRESHDVSCPLNGVEMLRLGTNEAGTSSAKLLVIVLNPNLGPLRYSWDCSNNINICYQVIENIQALDMLLVRCYSLCFPFYLKLEEYGEPVASLGVGHLGRVVEDPAGDAEPVLAAALGPGKQPADHRAEGDGGLQLPAQPLLQAADGGVGPPVLRHHVAVEVLADDALTIELSTHPDM